jgi:hypothetical protein
MKEAASLLKFCEMKGLECQPAKAAQAPVRCAGNSKQDGFVFSTAEIHAPSTAISASNAPQQ